MYKLTAPVLAALILGTAADASTILVGLSHPALAERLPGLDGFLGTADDVAAPGWNTSGIATVTHFQNVSPTAGSDYYSFNTSTLTINEPLIQLGGLITVDDFSVSQSNQDTNNRLTAGFDVASVLPHEIVYAVDGSLAARYTLRSCQVGLPNSCLELDVVLAGYRVTPGADPSLLPGISPELAAYFTYAMTLAPADWTWMTITTHSMTMTSANTRGNLAQYFVGGSMSGVTVLVTTDPIAITVAEPSSGGLLVVASGLAALARRRSGKASG